MRLRTILKVLGLLLVALVVAAVAYVLNFDPNSHKERIAAMVAEETGREVSFGGPIDLDIGLTTQLVVRDVSFSNAPWGSRPEMATIGLLEAEIRLLPLIGGEFDIERIVLRDADVLIETDAEGRSNLDFGNTDARSDESRDRDGAGVKLGVGQLRIENVKVAYRDAVTDRTIVAKLDRAIAVPAAPGAPLDVDIRGAVTLNQHVAVIDLDGQFGTSEAILSGNDSVPVNLTGTALGYDIAVEGGVRLPDNPDGVDVSISVTGDGLKAIQPFVSAALPKLGPVDIKAHVTGTPASPIVEDIRIAAARTVVTGKAELQPERGTASYTLKATLNGQDLGLVSPYVNLPLEDLGPLNGSINIVGDLETLRLEPKAVMMDKSRLSGSIEAGLNATPPKVKYDLNLTVDGQTLNIVEPFVAAELPALGPITGTVRAVGDQQKMRVEITSVQAGQSTLSGQLTATDLTRPVPSLEYDLSFQADAQSLDVIRPYLPEGAAYLGVINGSVQAVGSLDKAKVTLSEVEIDKTSISGQAEIDRTGDDIKANYDVRLVAAQQSLDILSPFIGADFPDAGPIDLTVSLVGDANQAKFENLSLWFAESELTGQGQVNLTGEVPELDASLNAPKFDLTRFFPDTTEVYKPEQISREEAERDAQVESGGRIFLTDPLPLEFLGAAQIDVTMKAGEFISPYGTYRDVDIRVVMENGSLNVRPLKANYAGSAISGNLSVDVEGGTPLVSVALSGPRIAVGQLLQDYANLDVLQGEGSVNLVLNGSGQSVADIMGSLNGHARVLMGQGRMRNEGLGYVSSVFSSIGEILGKKEWVVVECLASDFQIENGIATSKVGVINTEVIALTVGGKIDLKEERYDLKVTPSPRGLDISLAVPVNITGPLSDPGFSPDAIGSLTKLGSIFGSVIFPPAALIGLTEMGGNNHPCVEFAKKSAENGEATPTAPLQNGSGGGGVLNAPGRVLDGVGNGLKGILGR